MKLYLYCLIMFFISFLSKDLVAQEQNLTEVEKEEIISYLDSLDYEGAINDIKEFKISEAREKIEQVFWNDKFNKIDQLNLLDLLVEFNSPYAHSYALAYIDTLNNLPPDYIGPKPSSLIAQAAGFLVKLGDNSKVNLIFDFIEEVDQNYSFEIINLLPIVLDNVPSYEERAKSELLKIVNYSDWYLERYSALISLFKKYKSEMIPLVIQIFRKDENPEIRLVLLDTLITCCNNPELHKILKERLVEDPDYYVRYEISKKLLSVYGTPEDYKLILEYLPNENNSEYREYIQESLEMYKPPRPDTNETKSEIIDSLISYTNQVYEYGWINNEETYNTLSDKQNEIKSVISAENWLNALNLTNSYLQYVESALQNELITKDAYKFLYYYGEYLKERLVELAPQDEGDFIIKLINSEGESITGGTLKYYEGGWKDAIDNGDGTFTIETERETINLRMNYAFASQTINNVTVSTDTFAFQTVNTEVQLQDSQGNLIDEGAVKYYAGGWREFGTTINGVVEKELLPNNYSFRMSYAYSSNDKKQDIGVDPVVVFQTVNTQVQLQDSQGNLIDEGTVKYYAGGWREFGTTVNGVAEKELLPNNYSFRMNYAYSSNDKKQDIGVDPVVVFQTVNTQVQLQDSQGNLIDEGTVKYYAGGWREFGTTINGVVEKELLPNNYSFRMNYAYSSNDKKQDIGVDPVVVFQTVNTQVQLQDSQGNLIDEGTVKYYAGGWREFGTTINGVVEKELLPNNYSFRMNYAYSSNDKKQDIGVDPVVVFQTVNTQVQLQDSQGNLIDVATVKYYAGGWREFGTTVNGVAEKELLPNNYSFRMSYAFLSNDKQQDIDIDNVVTFSTVLCTVEVKDTEEQPLNDAVVRYYAGGWRNFGTSINGIITKELLPANISFRVNYDSLQEEKQQDISTNSTVEFIMEPGE